VRRAGVLAAVCVAAGVAVSAAGATNECKGLQVCVPVVGPWVVAGSGPQVSFQLSCPARFVVAGLDAELSRRGVDVTFRGSLGSPVNPGITTSRAAEFLARQLVGGAPATFRPHIGCVPAQGGGGRFPTAYHPVPPAPALAPVAVQVSVSPGVHRFAVRCDKGRHLVGATHAVGFYAFAPPAAAEVASVTVVQKVAGGAAHLVVRARQTRDRAIVQVDLECA
jgi:hypothetical protein